VPPLVAYLGIGERRVIIRKRLEPLRAAEQEVRDAIDKRDRELVSLASRFTHLQLAFELEVARQTIDKRVNAARGRLLETDAQFVADADATKSRATRRRQQKQGAKLAEFNTGISAAERRRLAQQPPRTNHGDNQEIDTGDLAADDESVRDMLRDAGIL
jgi:hypothetical protein